MCLDNLDDGIITRIVSRLATQTLKWVFVNLMKWLKKGRKNTEQEIDTKHTMRLCVRPNISKSFASV